MLPEILTVDITDEGGREVVHLDGQLDLSSSGQLEEALAKCRAPETVLDLSQLVFVDSTGFRVILGARDSALAEGRSLRLTKVRGQVRQFFDLAGWRELFG